MSYCLYLKEAKFVLFMDKSVQIRIGMNYRCLDLYNYFRESVKTIVLIVLIVKIKFFIT